MSFETRLRGFCTSQIYLQILLTFLKFNRLHFIIPWEVRGSERREGGGAWLENWQAQFDAACTRRRLTNYQRDKGDAPYLAYGRTNEHDLRV